MKFIIKAQGAKRELKLPFAICCSVDDLEQLERKIHEAVILAKDRGASYGWIVEVHDSSVFTGGEVMQWGVNVPAERDETGTKR